MKHLTILTLLMFMFCSSAHAASAKFYTFENDGAPKKRVHEVRATVEKCVAGLDNYFVSQPEKLHIVTYGNRDKWVKDLVARYGYSKETAEYFRKSSAPRPRNGIFLVPMEQLLMNVCHEIVHVYLETNTDPKHLLDAKWFDEGVACHLASDVMMDKDFGQYRSWFLRNAKSGPIPLSLIQSDRDWTMLHRNAKNQNIAYLQAGLMAQYFFSKYSIQKFQSILEGMKTHPFKKAFKDVTGISQEKFYAEWRKWVKK